MSRTVKLTKRIIESVVPDGRDVFLWDAHLVGFGARVKPSGVRLYLIQYRNRHGQTRRLTIGRHGAMTCEQARKEAVQQLAAVQAGADPSRDRHARRKAPTVNELLDGFLTDHVDMKLKPTTAREYRGMIERLARPAIGKILGHNSSITTARYAHLADDPVKQASNAVGQRLADAMNLYGTKVSGDHG